MRGNTGCLIERGDLDVEGISFESNDADSPCDCHHRRSGWGGARSLWDRDDLGVLVAGVQRTPPGFVGLVVRLEEVGVLFFQTGL